MSSQCVCITWAFPSRPGHGPSPPYLYHNFTYCPDLMQVLQPISFSIYCQLSISSGVEEYSSLLRPHHFVGSQIIEISPTLYWGVLAEFSSCCCQPLSVSAEANARRVSCCTLLYDCAFDYLSPQPTLFDCLCSLFLAASLAANTQAHFGVGCWLFYFLVIIALLQSQSAEAQFDVKDIVSCLLPADCAHQQPLEVRSKLAFSLSSTFPCLVSLLLVLFCFNLYPLSFQSSILSLCEFLQLVQCNASLCSVA